MLLNLTNIIRNSGKDNKKLYFEISAIVIATVYCITEATINTVLICFTDPPTVVATVPGTDVQQNSSAEIRCELVDGYPDRLNDVVWYKNDSRLDIGISLISHKL